MAAAVLLMAAAFPCTVTAAATEDAVRLLDVPYLAQTEQLCGGAAAAMVMRYWGARDVHADTFGASRVAGAGGIRGEDLLRALTARSWQATSFRGDKELVAKHLSLGRPIIAMIEDRPGAFHYVVLVAWAANRVICARSRPRTLQDPRRGGIPGCLGEKRLLDVAAPCWRTQS